MSLPIDDDESYLGQNLSISQLLHAAKRKLQGTAFGGRIATTLNEAEVNALEHDALQVLSLVRSVKNTFAFVNKTPQDVLSLIPNYWEDSDWDEGLIRLSHVCRGWRQIFTSCPSLWTHLACMNVDKTKVYIERSKSSPLEICLRQVGNTSYQEEAFILTVPHIGRLRSLSMSGNPTNVLPTLVEHFSCPVPLLNKLNINLICDQAPILPEELFNGDLSSLHELRLAGAITPLPWRGLLNLTTFELSRVPGDSILLNQILDFFESTPHLHHIQFHDSIPNSSNAPVERVVSLPHLKKLDILAQPAHSILLNHLSIPARVSLRLEFTFSSRESPIPSYLPESLENLNNLSHITAINLCFGSKQRSMRLNGPSGELYIIGNWARGGHQPHVGAIRFLSGLTFRGTGGWRLRCILIDEMSTLRPSHGSFDPWKPFIPSCSLNATTSLSFSP